MPPQDKRIAVLMRSRDEKEQLDISPRNYVCLPPVSTTSWLGKTTQCIEINRRGFAIVPDFASTIHSATGRILASGIPDLGAVKDKPNAPAAMEGMIALSLVKKREHVFIVRPFPPGLFRQVPSFFFLTLLLQECERMKPEKTLG